MAHLLVKTGTVGHDTPVVDVWPEFGALGKATASAIVGATPRWLPGTETGYHSFTYGFLVGEIARRATGKPMRHLLRETIRGLRCLRPEAVVQGSACVYRGAGCAGGDDMLTRWAGIPVAPSSGLVEDRRRSRSG